jgi:hypothetical protein
MNWKDFLKDVSKTVIENGDLRDQFKNEIESNWLGFDGVSDEKIKIHENRLKAILPPSYKEFLKTTNGFKQLNCFVWDILPLEKIDWLRNFDESFYEQYSTEFYETFNANDEEYFIYGEEQKTTDFRSEYLIKSLTVSDWGDSAMVLLNPEVKFGDEWEAWMFAIWHLGPIRYKSFEELMKEEHSSYLELLRDRE